MNKFFLLISLVFVCIEFKAQTHISGYISSDENLTNNSQVFLSIKSYHPFEKSNIITSAKVGKNGFFTINHKLPNKERLYNLFIDNKNHNNENFILSNSDSLIFQKSDTPFTAFTNTNHTDTEYQKFKRFIKKQEANSNNKTIYLNEIRAYTKDSLKILAIKLHSIKELRNKNLLKKDIALNPKYYSSLLQELKLSKINTSEYLFLEKELEHYNLKTIENKYSISRLTNYILGFIILLLTSYLFFSKFKKPKEINYDLSKQELNIKKLILEGKSNKDIAENLFISLSTVKTHITNIYNKLNVSNRAELISKFKN